MVCLAARTLSGTTATKQQIAKTEGISSDYVEQILIKLKAAGLVDSRRGVNGGFMLARGADKITLADVLDAAEGPIRFAPCQDDRCPRESACVTRNVWRAAEDAVRRVLKQKTVAALAAEASAMQQREAISFDI